MRRHRPFAVEPGVPPPLYQHPPTTLKHSRKSKHNEIITAIVKVCRMGVCGVKNTSLLVYPAEKNRFDIVEKSSGFLSSKGNPITENIIQEMGKISQRFQVHQ